MTAAIIAALLIAATSAIPANTLSLDPPLERPPLHIQDNGEAPDFTLTTLDGSELTLSDLRGKVVVLNFWATWCAPCRYEVPYFIRLQDEYADDVRFVGVSVDQGGWDDVRPFAEEFGINYPLVLDDGQVSEDYGGAYVLPTTFVLDRDGRIEIFAPGMLHEDDLREVLEMMVAGVQG